ncbi:MAG: NUDIX domain-containing protein [Oscillospiraceae bacterium]|nr:NUDIX domain-containing protein [Oscillospiraceae bacterium]
MDCSKVYETGLLYHHYANTAYPLTPGSFKQYKLTDEAEIISLVKEEWKKTDELSLYIHIPFCKTRCKFCEYTVLEGTDENTENEYVELLLGEMKMYSEILKGKKIVGYDLGGGTPTKLSTRNLKRITDALHSMFDVADGVVFSIETTPLIAANEPEKIKAVYDMGYRRISMGVQTVSEKLLSELGRDGSKSIYERAVENIRLAGFSSFNIDLMYGFLHQSEADFDNTLHYAIGLGPEHITLYRNRYKGTKLEYESGGVSIYKAMYQYRIAYRVLTENGYMANVGKNTFSKVEGDYGTSDYLTKRVINGTPYVGMGLGAQSFGMGYLAYNSGAADKKLDRYREAIGEGRLPFQDIYRLPQDEAIAKMVSVAFYFAFIDMEAFKRRFGLDFKERFADEMRFVLENELMEIKGSRLYLTERGADYINGVIPLFYSERSKRELETAFAGKQRSEKSDEELFLSAYDIENYDRPSVAADIAAFSVRAEEYDLYRKDAERRLTVLLIRRGEHPYMNCWALPGGFLRPDETIEDCALREITEETNLTPVTLMPVGVFSEPGRDPRGRIISNAYTSVISETQAKIMGGDDAIDAKWFDVRFEIGEDDLYHLILKHNETVLTASLREEKNKFGRSKFEIIENDALAFDHAEIIATALSALRTEAGKIELALDFLPEKFTLAALQKVQETLTGISLLTANFRRKIAEYVVETDEYTEGAGHRPARLFKRKDQRKD